MKHLPAFHRALLVSLIGALTSFLASAAGGPAYREPWRPQFHFTPATNWMNDPNGMVFCDGEYHLFYQCNPWGDQWGHMSWGHAVSRDLVHWEHLPVALHEEKDVMIFSGSAVVDRKNTSGFGREGNPPMVALYTGSYTKRPLQNQHIAYSNDRGRTWTKFADNPVLDIGAKDFRDPKVAWHEPTRRWVMTVAWPVERKVRFYSSPDLKRWTHLSDFGPAGSTDGIWECPDLFPIRVEGRRGVEKWALVVNVASGAPAGGSGCQYFVGNFDGERFIPDSPDQPAFWADFGPDFYAAVSWSDLPRRDGRRIWLGWMSNWQYANDVPTTPWRGAMSLARELSLRNTGGGLRLVQQPVKELQVLRGRSSRLALRQVRGPADLSGLDDAVADLFELEADLQPGPDAGFLLRLRTGATEETVLRVDVPRHELLLDRARSGNVTCRGFSTLEHAPVRVVDGHLRLHLFVDTSSVEVFANDGEVSLTSLVFPTANGRRLELEVTRGALLRADFKAWKLGTAWPRNP